MHSHYFGIALIIDKEISGLKLRVEVISPGGVKKILQLIGQ
jgi:hypothetical protein